MHRTGNKIIQEKIMKIEPVLFVFGCITKQVILVVTKCWQRKYIESE